MENALSAQYLDLDLRLKLSTAALAMAAAAAMYKAKRDEFGYVYKKSRDAVGTPLHAETVEAGHAKNAAEAAYVEVVNEVAAAILAHNTGK